MLKVVLVVKGQIEKKTTKFVLFPILFSDLPDLIFTKSTGVS